MRLGDFDALKADIIEKHCFGMFTENIIEVVDNAPTVEAYTPEQVKELVDLNKKLSEERPQGEWITKTEDNGVNYRFYCSCCNREVLLITEFCPNCGAEMKGGTE